MSRQIRSLAAKFYPIPALLVAWQLSASTVLKTRLLPAPIEVGTALVADLANGRLIYNAEVTIGRALAGFFLAILIGAVLAAAMSSSRRLAGMIQPLFAFGYPVPKIALFPVFAFAFGIGSSSKIAFTTVECLFPIVISIYMGICGIEKKLMWTAENMGAGKVTLFRRIMIPAAMPSIFAGLRIALPLALTVVVVTEMIGGTEGLGAYITIWSTRFRYANVYAGIVAVGICGMILDRAVVYAGRWLLPWMKEAPT